MYRLHLYLTEELKDKLYIKSKITGRTKAEIAREALEEGLKKAKSIKSDSARALLMLARIAEDLPSIPGSPKDVSNNHDYYAWGKENKQ